MSGEKPNFAEIARIYNCDYRTVKKRYERGELKLQTVHEIDDGKRTKQSLEYKSPMEYKKELGLI